MGRRHSAFPKKGLDERSSIGDSHVNEAVLALSKTCQTTVAVMTEYNKSLDETLHMLFKDEDLEKAAAARHLVDPVGSTANYNVVDGAFLKVNFGAERWNCSTSRYMTLKPEAMNIHADRIEPLLAFIAEVKAIHDKFEEVKAVLRWLNRNATPGAIRYFFPTALQLCPQSPALMELRHVPSRYTTPPHISYWSQAIKDAAATVTGSLLLPATAAPKESTNLTLTILARAVPLPSISFDEKPTYSATQMNYNI